MLSICPQCQKEFDRPTGEVNRARNKGAPLYCGRTCAGRGRRVGEKPSYAERKALKAEYDRAYREKNREKRKAQKAEYFRRTYDPAAAAIIRKANMPKHVEYCRRPEYKKLKSTYDRKYRAVKEFGAFAEAALILQDVEKEVLERATRYEISLINGTLNKAQKRRRQA